MVTCEFCGCQYLFHFDVTATGGSTSFLWLDNKEPIIGQVNMQIEKSIIQLTKAYDDATGYPVRLWYVSSGYDCKFKKIAIFRFGDVVNFSLLLISLRL